MTIDPSSLLPQLEEMARGAGEILMKHHGHLDQSEIDFKGKRDLQSRADRESEAFLLDEIARRFPDHAVLAEESHGRGADDLLCGDRPLWVIDPLDGTTNFVAGLPLFCVSIGLQDADGPLAAAIHAPCLGETYLAARGAGATLGKRRLRVTETDQLIDAVLATGFAYRVEELEDDNLDHFCRLVPRTRAIRRCGSAALDLAWVAAGRFDGFWELHLSPWDVAAGALLVREAGGLVTDLAGGDDWIFGHSIVAAGPAMHARLLDDLRGG
ncbi:MAG: inositol monophosphatase [Planctomycetes bacterium]|nr:inositol monophosphatase [Planctomycetota bacterium]